ncbi:RNA polymerase II subunit 5-mediating protein [Actinidia chinensis var. chinensis]|uniref:RNA polymerase II subunit 5-mediating protein n=1 Tax=Actinidia chinensis var. chinensis TaxID=1590841 RepID=A0A2R6QC54_ACTCC|nr:RNA polymerase II subunit 5-mediating protein [Actinidia chinensis var. chinensis]
MDGQVKGTVTKLSSLFPVEEAQKAAKRVEETIAERQKELNLVGDFIADNRGLINLVQKLPDELHHDIMVPFGKAAFFPGRLIHTNKFLVLLGEGYYTERTSKQTVDILKRREKALESQVESLKAVMQDLKAEASFFDATATEVAEGLVEIREEYIDNASPEKVSEAGSMTALTEDEEYANMMSKFEEFEKEELAEESDNECDEDEEYGHMISKFDKLEEVELATKLFSKCNEDENIKLDFGHYRSEYSFDQKHRNSEGHQLNSPPKQSKDAQAIGEELPSKHAFQRDLCNQFEDSKLQSVSEDVSPSDQSYELTQSISIEKASVLPEVKENIQAEPHSKNKAFTGSIVEHTHNLEMKPREQTTATSQSTTTQTSKPVSRFKMQRR